jgi:hypothetical protein
MASYKSLLEALEGLFGKPLNALPKMLRKRVEDEFFPISWGMLSPDQRRAVAIQCDVQDDPRFDLERRVGFDRAAKRKDLKWQIETWNTVPVSSASEAETKEHTLKSLHAELRRLTPRHERTPRSSGPPIGYIAYPRAAAALKSRLGATPEEIAAWIHFGPELGGLAAYRNANELSPPPRFFYDILLQPDGDYLAPLAGCWFAQEDVEKFVPTERYITGAALLDAWESSAGNARVFITAKISESRLDCIHPIFGGTRELFGNDEEFPPMEAGLFARSEVTRIADEDLPSPERVSSLLPGEAEGRRRSARHAANARHAQPGGTREKHEAIRAIWAKGTYLTRDLCAEKECGALGMSFSTARKALRNTPAPKGK